MKRIGRLGSLDEEKAAAKSLMSARDGDTRLLDKRLQSSEATEEECAFYGDLKSGKIKRPANRPPMQIVQLRREHLQRFLGMALADRLAGKNSWKMTAIVVEGARLYRFSERKVWGFLKELRHG